MKYFTLVGLLAALSTATSCCHSKYSQAHVPSTPLFAIGNEVKLSMDSQPCKSGLRVCGGHGFVTEVVDLKNHCYPQATYYVKFYYHIDTYRFCSADLILVKEGS